VSHAVAKHVASDIRTSRVEDVSFIKKMSGGDTISAEPKHRDPFRFRFDGLSLWTANTVPTVTDPSGAYLSRIRRTGSRRPSPTRKTPRRRPTSSPTNSRAPRPPHRRAADDRAPGAYLIDANTRAEAEAFALASDRVRLFLADWTDPDEASWVDQRDLFRAFNT
jgi:putative DNA primase/helicase